MKIIDSLVLLEGKVCEYELADDDNKPFSATQYEEILKAVDILQEIIGIYNNTFVNQKSRQSRKSLTNEEFINHLREDGTYIIDVPNMKIQI